MFIGGCCVGVRSVDFDNDEEKKTIRSGAYVISQHWQPVLAILSTLMCFLSPESLMSATPIRVPWFQVGALRR